jgi:hypothetical protein
MGRRGCDRLSQVRGESIARIEDREAEEEGLPVVS